MKALFARGITKKAYSIIEVIIALAIFATFLLFELSMLLKSLRSFEISLENTRNSYFIDETFNFIERKLSDSYEVYVSGNNIHFKEYYFKGDKLLKKESIICLKPSETINVLSFEGGFETGSNVICRNIKNFEINIKGRCFYVKITNGRLQSERCFNFKKCEEE